MILHQCLHISDYLLIGVIGYNLYYDKSWLR